MDSNGCKLTYPFRTSWTTELQIFDLLSWFVENPKVKQNPQRSKVQQHASENQGECHWMAQSFASFCHSNGVPNENRRQNAFEHQVRALTLRNIWQLAPQD